MLFRSIVLFIAVAMLFFTAWFGFPNFRHLPLSFRIVSGGMAKPGDPGEMTQFQALSTALSGTVGLGNIAGVALAIQTGGPGAAFWIFVIGWFAMSLKMAEVTLGLKYREVHPTENHVLGGPMYSMKNGLAARGWPRLGKWMGFLYAFLALFGAITLAQVNQSYVMVSQVTGISAPWTYGVIMALLVGAVVIAGAHWLGRVASALVPSMAVLYLIGLACILTIHADRIPGAISTILAHAFGLKAMGGGALGAFIIGMQRVVYSTEAGVGSAVMAHTQARTREPVSEGLVALIEPFIDTVVICSLGALTLVVADTWHDGVAIQITSAAFAQVSAWFPILLAVAAFLFAYSTLVSWGFYGLQAWYYMFSDSKGSEIIYKIAFVSLLPMGAALTAETVYKLIDSTLFLMAVPNVILLYIFAGELRRDVRDYLARIKSGAVGRADQN